MSDIIYYHNPQCSKSCAGLALLNELAVSITIKQYLTDPLTLAELVKILTLCGRLACIRKKESLYPTYEKDIINGSITDIATIIIRHPCLLERPILLRPDYSAACIGRPLSRIHSFLN